MRDGYGLGTKRWGNGMNALRAGTSESGNSLPVSQPKTKKPFLQRGTGRIVTAGLSGNSRECGAGKGKAHGGDFNHSTLMIGARGGDQFFKQAREDQKRSGCFPGLIGRLIRRAAEAFE